MRHLITGAALLALVATGAPVFALNTGTDIIVPAAGRGTPWATDFYVANPGETTVTGSIYWLVRGVANPDPAVATFTLAPGATGVWADIIFTEFGLASGNGAFRVTASDAVIVNSRIFATDGSATFGQGFEGVPVSAATQTGATASVVGLSNNSAFRTNIYATAGANGVRMTVRLLDPAGAAFATANVVLAAWEPYLKRVDQVFTGVANFDDATLTAEVTAGSVVVGASKVDNESTDPTTLESNVDSAETADGVAPARVGKTGQVTCYDDDLGRPVACAGTGQDGDIRPGVGWPNPRFVDKGDGTVVDMLTGLYWLTNANCFNKKRWSTALALADGLASGACGLTDGSVAGDWRLPSRFELESLLDLEYYAPPLSNAAGTAQWTEGDAFSGVQSEGYWSSTSFIGTPVFACYVHLTNSLVYADLKNTNLYVWPVRDGQ